MGALEDSDGGGGQWAMVSKEVEGEAAVRVGKGWSRINC